MAIPSTTASAAIEEAPVLGDSTAKAPEQKFVIRPAHFSDLPAMGVIAKQAYWLSPVNNLIAPRAAEHPEDVVRIMQQARQRGFAVENSLSLVACVPAQGEDDGEKVVGYGQFYRKGDDAGARKFVKSKGLGGKVGLWALGWWFWTCHSVSNWVWPDRVSDAKAAQEFRSAMQLDDDNYWTPFPERHARWHAGSLCVNPEYQGQGVGKLLMGHVIKKAQDEGVPLGLTASPHGEFLYRKLGFEMLGDFSRKVADDVGGGIMILYPKSWQGKRHDE